MSTRIQMARPRAPHGVGQRQGRPDFARPALVTCSVNRPQRYCVRPRRSGASRSDHPRSPAALHREGPCLDGRDGRWHDRFLRGRSPNGGQSRAPHPPARTARLPLAPDCSGHRRWKRTRRSHRDQPDRGVASRVDRPGTQVRHRLSRRDLLTQTGPEFRKRDRTCSGARRASIAKSRTLEIEAHAVGLSSVLNSGSGTEAPTASGLIAACAVPKIRLSPNSAKVGAVEHALVNSGLEVRFRVP